MVRLYKKAASGTGSGTSEAGSFDPAGTVYRMYMEFCDAGDLNNYRESKLDAANGEPRSMVPEEHFWRMLHCLARGLLVMEQGSEDPMIPKPSADEWRP